MGDTLQITIVICELQYYTILEYANNVFQEVYCIYNNQNENWFIIFCFCPIQTLFGNTFIITLIYRFDGTRLKAY